MKFREWKGLVRQVLSELESRAWDEREKLFLRALVLRLDTLRHRDLPLYIRNLHEYCRLFNRRDVCQRLLAEEVEPGG